MPTSPARRLWAAVETLHAVTYFHPTALAALADAGAKGFWMGYFAGRLAPMGPIGPALGTAVCFNFSPARTYRALPDAWDFVTPGAALAARTSGSADALRSCGVAEPDGPAVLEPLEALVAGLDPAGRPLGAANLDLPPATDPIERLWQLCTTVREHRGDGHVALLTGAGLDGCEANVLATAVSGFDPMILRDTRAWTGEQWDAATDRLVDDGTVTPTGGPTDRGQDLHADIEDRTDALALDSYLSSLEIPQIDALTDALRAVGAPVVDARVLPFPNPMGLQEG